jgi:hypothetical protein
MSRITSTLGYAAAALTMAGTIFAPFVLFVLFARGVAATGIQVDPVFSGGTISHRLARGGYHIDVYQPVRPHGLLSRVEPFVQLSWTPAAALPAHISDMIDIDNDGQPDLQVSFNVPTNAQSRPSADVTALSPRFRSGKVPDDSANPFASLLERTGDRVILRVERIQRP